jgi:hypothetical protein
MVRVSTLKVGDRVDLEGDQYADPNANPYLEFEWAVVGDFEWETPGCIRVDFDHGSVGFPPDHLVKIDS